MVEAQPAFQGDPFLRSCFGEKLADLYLKEALLSQPSPSRGSLEKAVEALRTAALGYPAAHLFNHMGNTLLLLDNDLQARAAFEKALKAPLNLTDSARFLR